MARTHPLIRAGAAAQASHGGIGGEDMSPPDWGSIDHKDCAWFGAGGEVTSPNPARGSQGATIRPLLGFSADAMTAFNPRRVDLWGVGERLNFPYEGSNTDMFAWS